LAIAILASGLALLMYPAVFANKQLSPNRTPQIAFFSFCGLSCLLVMYIVDRQSTIQRLRHQIAIDRVQASEALKQASADILGTMSNFSIFADRLSMEFRRAVTATLTFSVFVVTVKLRPDFSDSSVAMSALSDAAKALSRKLREQDSVYLLRRGVFGAILPGVGTSTARRISLRFSEGLTDAAGATDRFSFQIDVVNYPEHATTSRDLEVAVCGYLPEGDAKENLVTEASSFQ
jgi:GGDEF domain-containing protein